MADDDTLKRAFLSYIKLRRVLGILGVLLPFILAGWGFALCECVEFQGAISDYYALRTRDALVGILFAIAWFLLTYRGYEKRDDIAGDLACVSALGVALFPSKGAEWEQTVHYISAASLFLVLSYFSLRLFTKTDENRPLTAEKKTRNRIYRICGVVILVCIGSIGLYHLFFKDTMAVADLKPVFWLQSFALWAFGVSWFVKGQTLWQDARAWWRISWST